MEKTGSITRWLLIGVGVFLFVQFGWPRLFGSKAETKQPLGQSDETALEEPQRKTPEMCTIEGDGFRAILSSKGGALQYDGLTAPRFADDGSPHNLVTTSRESRMPIRTDLRAPSALGANPQTAEQVPFDDLDWTLDAAHTTPKSCAFVYKDASSELTKTVSTTDRPYQLAVKLTVKNLAAEPRVHRLTLEQTDWRRNKDIKGGMLQRQPDVTEVVAAGKKVERHHPDAFKASDFSGETFTPEKWRRAPGDARFVATSSNFFTKVAIPLEGPTAAAETQIEERWNEAQYGPNKESDPDFGFVYRARLAYPEITLQPGKEQSYTILTYGGPKHREELAALPGDATEVLDLGMFAKIAHGLMWYLSRLHGVIGNWGIAIILLTLSVRMLLFPLSLAQIRSGIAMRKLKPEMDVINDKYKDDATQRGVAIQELWRRNNVANPVVGCLPMLLQMPVWFALYTSLQKSVELYHTPFLWFGDLTQPDKFFIIPLVLGASSFIQQKIMPQQGDPQQQKMMLYMMPAMFTFMMLFLPSGLGVYMLTNSLIGITQQLLIERYQRSQGGRGGRGPGSASIQVRDKTPDDDGKASSTRGKEKTRAHG